MQINGLDFNIQASGEGTPFIWAHGLMSSMESGDRLDWFEGVCIKKFIDHDRLTRPMQPTQKNAQMIGGLANLRKK